MQRTGGRAPEAEGTASAKALGQDWTWQVGGTAGRPGWTEQTERGGDREEGRTGRGTGLLPPGRWEPWRAMLRSLPAMQKTQVQSLVQQEPPGEEKASILAWRIL